MTDQNPADRPLCSECRQLTAGRCIKCGSTDRPKRTDLNTCRECGGLLSEFPVGDCATPHVSSGSTDQKPACICGEINALQEIDRLIKTKPQTKE